MYVSLGKFSAEENQVILVSEKEANEDDVIERQILLQLYARFHQRDIPLSSYKLI